MMFKKNRLLILLLTPYIICAAHQINVHTITEEELQHFSVTASSIAHKGATSAINIVTDGTHTYIVKQIKNPSLKSQLLLAIDAVCSTIGVLCGIQVNTVSFIPYDVGAHLKIYPDRAATLHTYSPGTDVEEKIPPLISDTKFSLCQQRIQKRSFLQKRGHRSKQRQGITRDIIIHMSVHPDLPPLVAFDTFIGNPDRSLSNILYEKDKNRFFGIDHGAGLSSLLIADSYYILQELILHGYFTHCSNHVKESLLLYKRTLTTLATTVDSKIIDKLLNDLIPYVLPHARENIQRVYGVTHVHKIFKKNLVYLPALIQLLDILEAD